MNDRERPVVLITGASGNIGRSLTEALRDRYQIVGIDRDAQEGDAPIFKADFTSSASLAAAFEQVRRRFGTRIASVVHLVAYYDFTGEPNPLYEQINIEGTRSLLRQLQQFDVEQFVYASTMLVHAPCRPGGRIDETAPIDPRWAYPQSKADAEAVIQAEHGTIPYVILRLAGVYDEATVVPTLAQQIARIYDRSFESYFYSGSGLVGQSMLHREDMLDAFVRTIDRRDELPRDTAILIGEEEAIGYDALQDDLGYLIHGDKNWPTLRVPKPLAAAGAWAQDKLEPIIPDAFDQGEDPFIKPFMIFMADDHYALDISRARSQLGWAPKHHLKEVLPAMVANLRADPLGWYKRNKVTPPQWMTEASSAGDCPEDLRTAHAEHVHRLHASTRWAHLTNMALGIWLITQPVLIQVEEIWLARSEMLLGLALIVFAALALSWRAQWARWVCAGIGALVAAIPFLFWTENAAAYLSDTLVGGLILALAVGSAPEPGPSPVAAMTGPEIPSGWTYNPSNWAQRVPIIALALIGLLVSRYLAAYQLGHIDSVWEPFFAGSPDNPLNGTEEIITSSVSEAWPVSDAAVGGYTYLLEIVTGVIGSEKRWRTMPWLVILFGLMIAPLGVISVSFIIIQPIVIGTWSTVALIGAAAVLVQIPYALDELLASVQFIRRRIKAGQNWLRVLIVGDTDEGDTRPSGDEFDTSPKAVLKDMLGGGVNLPWNLAAAGAIGLWLMLTRLTLGAEGGMANADHLVGALTLTVVSIAAAEVARPARYLLIPLGLALMAAPFFYDAGAGSLVSSLACGVALIGLSIRRGAIHERYGSWDRLIV